MHKSPSNLNQDGLKTEKKFNTKHITFYFKEFLGCFLPVTRNLVYQAVPTGFSNLGCQQRSVRLDMELAPRALRETSRTKVDWKLATVATK